MAPRFRRYSPSGAPDSVDECLVPYDFDWTPEHAILDRQFSQLYSQLPYDCYFVAMLDCCHSGGMTRDGGPRIRGLTPPDDIRHRALRWEASEGMWVPREFPPLNGSLSKSKNGADYLGDNGATAAAQAQASAQEARSDRPGRGPNAEC